MPNNTPDNHTQTPFSAYSAQLPKLQQELQELSDRLSQRRKVRAIAQTGSFGSQQAWAGSRPQLMTFERGLDTAISDYIDGVLVERWPYQHLEDWREWQNCRAEAPLAKLATSSVIYDPTGYCGRIQRMLEQLNASQWASYRQELTALAQQKIGQLQSVSDSTNFSIISIVKARQLATELLYPALLSHLQTWPQFELRLPHAWRAVAGMSFPKAIYKLEQLYGFAGETEARQLLIAARGMGLSQAEKSARMAVQTGYYDGAVRYLRDAAGISHLENIERWEYLSSARRDKLSTLLGLTRVPLGSAALELTDQLLKEINIK